MLLWSAQAAFADVLTTKGGMVYEGTVIYQDTSVVKIKLNSTNEVNVFMRVDIASIRFSGAPQVTPTQSGGIEPTLDEAEWERRGEVDGGSTAGTKSLLAGTGGCVFGTLGGLMLGAPTMLTAGGGGTVGCLGGWGLGHIGQQAPKPPSDNRVYKEAYLRGFQRGVNRSNTTAILVGSGTTLLAILGTALIIAASIQ
jgi:hypothetical protein